VRLCSGDESTASQDRSHRAAKSSSYGVLFENSCVDFNRVVVSFVLLRLGVASLRYVNPSSVLTSQDRREARRPNIRDFTTHMNSSVFFGAHFGNQLASREIETETCGYFDLEALP
jgi:hypothetical protein